MNGALPNPKKAPPAPAGWDLEEVVATTWAVIAACGWTPITSDSSARHARVRHRFPVEAQQPASTVARRTAS